MGVECPCGRALLDLAGSVAKAFEGSGEGPAFTASLRRAIIHDAVEMFLTPPKDREQKQQAVFSKEFKDGSQAEQRLLNTRARRKPAQSTKAKDDDDEGTPAALNHAFLDLLFRKGESCDMSCCPCAPSCSL